MIPPLPMLAMPPLPIPAVPPTSAGTATVIPGPGPEVEGDAALGLVQVVIDGNHAGGKVAALMADRGVPLLQPGLLMPARGVMLMQPAAARPGWYIYRWRA